MAKCCFAGFIKEVLSELLKFLNLVSQNEVVTKEYAENTIIMLEWFKITLQYVCDTVSEEITLQRSGKSTDSHWAGYLGL